MIDYVTIGKRIRYYRQRKGFTQERLAYAINTSPTYISYIERAKKKPSLEKIVQISEVLEVSVNDLVTSINVDARHILDIERLLRGCNDTEKKELLLLMSEQV